MITVGFDVLCPLLRQLKIMNAHLHFCCKLTNAPFESDFIYVSCASVCDRCTQVVFFCILRSFGSYVVAQVCFVLLFGQRTHNRVCGSHVR